MKKRKKAISPIISTVLLIMIVIILAIIILLWSRGFIKESILKKIADEEKRVEQYCSEVKIQQIIENDGSFGFQNIGVVPIYQFDLKLSEKDTGETITKKGNSVNPQFSVIFSDSSSGMANIGSYDNYEKIKVIPILLGTKKSGETEPFTCPETYAIDIKDEI